MHNLGTYIRHELDSNYNPVVGANYNMFRTQKGALDVKILFTTYLASVKRHT